MGDIIYLKLIKVMIRLGFISMLAIFSDAILNIFVENKEGYFVFLTLFMFIYIALSTWNERYGSSVLQIKLIRELKNHGFRVSEDNGFKTTLVHFNKEIIVEINECDWEMYSYSCLLDIEQINTMSSKTGSLKEYSELLNSLSGLNIK